MNPRPKFCVGQEVMIRSKSHPEDNIDRTEITSMKYCEYINYSDLKSLGRCWGYKVLGSPYVWNESALRKLPPKNQAQWSTSLFKPEEVNV